VGEAVDKLALINRPPNLKAFGRLIRILRTRHQLTLRALAEKVNFSHAYMRKVEYGETALRQHLYDRLCRVFDLDLCVDKTLQERFYDLKKTIEHDILYLNSLNMRTNLDVLEQDANLHAHSLWVIDYMILYVGCMTFVPYKDHRDADSTITELDSVVEMMSDAQRQRYYLYRGLYHYCENEHDAAVRDYQHSLSFDVVPGLKPLALYLIGRVYGETFRLPESNEYYRRAESFFHASNNEMRASNTRFLGCANRIKMRTFDGVVDVLDEALNFAHRHQLSSLASAVRFHYMLYHFLRREHEAALAMLAKTTEDSLRIRFYHALNRFYSRGAAAATDYLEQLDLEHPPAGDRMILYRYGLRFLWRYVMGEPYEQELEWFFQESFTTRSYIEVQIAYRYLVDLYEDTRRYKDAFELTQNIIAITKQALF